MKIDRTLVAGLLTAVAVAVPSGAWLIAGGRQLDRESVLEEQHVYEAGHRKAVVLAERLATRLEVLRKNESDRPFYHYQNLYHDPRGAAEGAAISVSPLAEGPVNALIQTHFQVDEDGELTLPTLNDELPELQTTDSRYCSLFQSLEEVAAFSLQSLLDTASGRPRGGLQPEPPIRQARVETLGEGAWQQHLQANALYADLKYRRSPEAEEGEGCRIPSHRGGSEVAIMVDDFEWHTLPVAGKPSLVALRTVDTPQGLWTQGFVISDAAVTEILSDAEFPVAFEPTPPEAAAASLVRVPVDGTPWAMTLNVASGLARAVTTIGQERGRFYRTVFLCALAAAFAGLLVVTMVRQSERLAAQQARFAAHAAHELRTPLAGMRLYSEMLAEGLGNPARTRDYARRLAGEAERLGRVVTNVLSFTRLERKNLSLRPELGDLRSAVLEAYNRQQPLLEEAGAQVELDLPADLPDVHYDRDAVTHIVQNLLDNAEKYTRDIEGRRIRVSLRSTARAVVLSVMDNGRGISRRLRRKIFRPFVRGRDGDGPEGVGLGLVLVRSLAAAQGGEVAYRDAPAGGAVFEVSFPR